MYITRGAWPRTNCASCAAQGIARCLPSPPPPPVVHLALENINGRLIPTAEVTSLREQTTKARITEIYLFFKKTNFFARYFGLQYKPSSGAERKRKVRNSLLTSHFSFSFSPRGRFVLQTEISGKKICFFKKQIYFSYSSFCCLLSQACHLRRWDQSAVNIFYLR